jgi:hypothetical protein
MAAVLSLGHSPAYRLEDFRPAQFGDQQPERVAARRRIRANIAARSGASLDNAG